MRTCVSHPSIRKDSDVAIWEHGPTEIKISGKFEERAMAGIEVTTEQQPKDGVDEHELSLADTAAFRALRDATGFDPYNSTERIERKKAWVREPWKALPR
jgi:hypothetical protein